MADHVRSTFAYSTKSTIEKGEIRHRALLMLKDGKTIREVARTIGCAEITVGKWKKKWVEQRKLPKGRRYGPRKGAKFADQPAPAVSIAEKHKTFHEHVANGANYLIAGNLAGVTAATAYTWFMDAMKAGTIDAAAAVLQGPRPTRTNEENEEIRKILVRMVAVDGHNLKESASALRISYPTAKRWIADAGVLPPEASERPPDPIPYDNLTQEAKDLLADFGAFRLEVLGRSSEQWAVEVAHQLLELYLSPEEEYAVVNEAPGLGKSTLITHDFLVWVIARERSQGREPRILVGHAAEPKAVWYVKRLRLTLTMNDKLIRLYGRFKPTSNLASWSTTELLIEPLDWKKVGEKEPTVSAAAYGKTLLSARHTLQVWDDLLDKANQATPEQRDAVFEWWDQYPESRVESGGLLILSNARYGPEDLSRTLTEQRDVDDDADDDEGRPLYHHIKHPAHVEAKCLGDETHLITTNEDGERIFPPAWPEGCLLDPRRVGWKKVRRAMVKNVGKFRIIYQQENADPVGMLAEKVWFEGGMGSDGGVFPGMFVRDRRFLQNPREATKEMPLVSAVTVDPSGSKYWAIEHWLSYADGVQSLLQGIRRPMDAHEILYRGLDGNFTGLLEEWWQASSRLGLAPTYVIVEGNGFQRHFAKYPFFRQWAQVRGITLIPHDTVMNKADPDMGIDATLGPLYRFQQAELPYLGIEERLFADQLCREAVSFPEGQFSDCVMAHWFFCFKLPTLAIVRRYVDRDTSDVPAWVEHEFNHVPAFAEAMLGGATPRVDRGEKVMRELWEKEPA